MGRKSQYDQLVDAIRARLREMDHSNAETVEEAATNEQTIRNAFGIKPLEDGAHDYCPDHPTSVRYHGQCSQCPE